MVSHMTNQLDHAFHALADPTRRAILARLAQGPAAVGQIETPIRMAMPTLLQHLRVLERGGLIATEKQGRQRICHLRPQAVREAEAWLSRQRAVWEARLDQLDAYVLTLKEQENG